MSDIFREVDEAIQQEKFEKIWQEYKTTIITGIVVLLLSTAAATGWRSWNTAQDEKQTARIVNALESDNPIEALTSIAGDSRPIHETVALLSAANLHIEKKDYGQAAALYQQAYESKKVKQPFNDLARLLYVRSSLIQNQESGSDYAALIDILQPILSREKSPWIWHARLEAATLHGSTEDYTKALELLNFFDEADDLIPTLKDRARSVQHVYKILSAQKEEGTKG